MRIDKYICDTINITRTQAKDKISSGTVYLNGIRVRSSSEKVNENADRVVVDGNEISYNKYVYIMLNKPSGVISATEDKSSMTAIDLLCAKDKRHDLFVAGRLDKNTTGFLLITNDGNLAHSILPPKKHIFKTYKVGLAYPLEDDYSTKIVEGVVLEDGYKCKSGEYYPLSKSECLLRISEGKFHQIKRMFKALGNEVVSLSRIAMGDLLLDKSLSEGEYRYIEQFEIEKIMNKITKNDLESIGMMFK